MSSTSVSCIASRTRRRQSCIISTRHAADPCRCKAQFKQCLGLRTGGALKSSPYILIKGRRTRDAESQMSARHWETTSRLSWSPGQTLRFRAPDRIVDRGPFKYALLSPQGRSFPLVSASTPDRLLSGHWSVKGIFGHRLDHGWPVPTLRPLRRPLLRRPLDHARGPGFGSDVRQPALGETRRLFASDHVSEEGYRLDGRRKGSSEVVRLCPRRFSERRFLNSLLCDRETDGIPDSAKGHRGKVLLGYRTKGSESEHLDVGPSFPFPLLSFVSHAHAPFPGPITSPDHPLASNFKITRGHVSFRLPSTLKARNRYIVVLMGNSGNASPEFKILASSHEIKMQTAAEGKRGLVVAMDDDQDEE